MLFASASQTRFEFRDKGRENKGAKIRRRRQQEALSKCWGGLIITAQVFNLHYIPFLTAIPKKYDIAL